MLLQNYQLQHGFFKFLSTNEKELLTKVPKPAHTKAAGECEMIEYFPITTSKRKSINHIDTEDDLIGNHQPFGSSKNSLRLSFLDDSSLNLRPSDSEECISTFQHIHCTILDPICTYASPLVLCGATNSVPIVFAFRYVLIECIFPFFSNALHPRLTDSVDQMMHKIAPLLHSVANHIKATSTPLFLVAQYSRVSI